MTRILGFTFFISIMCSLSATGQETAKTDDVQSVDQCIERAATYLLSKQHRSGCFSDKKDPFEGDLDEWRRRFRAKEIHPPRHSTAFTALSILSLASIGHQPRDPTKEGRALASALDYILEEPLVRDGYLGRTDHSRMYGHGIITLMLTEMCGMGKTDQQDQLIRVRCEAALNVILSAQQVKKSLVHRGGWRYNPNSKDSDLSVTVWQLMALRSARNAGFTVPKKSIDDAIAYLKVCYNSDRDAQGQPTNLNTGFCYQKGRNPEFATSAAGLLALQVSGAYDSPEVKACSRYLLSNRMTPDQDVNWFYYGIYYYAQGMAQRGGETASRAKDITESLLMAIQNDDGSFKGRGEEGSQIYSTAMAILSLSIQHHYLPIYQR